MTRADPKDGGVASQQWQKAGGMSIARRLRAGMVHVNDATPQDEALAPFGGIGQSGLGGRSGGDANTEEIYRAALVDC